MIDSDITATYRIEGDSVFLPQNAFNLDLSENPFPSYYRYGYVFTDHDEVVLTQDQMLNDEDGEVDFDDGIIVTSEIVLRRADPE